MDERPPRLGKHLIEVIRKQIDDGDPPAVAETYARLLDEGYAEDAVYGMIACALTAVHFAGRREERDLDPERYAERLRALPEMPWGS